MLKMLLMRKIVLIRNVTYTTVSVVVVVIVMFAGQA